MTRKAFFRSAIAALALSCAAGAAAQSGAPAPTDCRVRIDANATSWVIRGYDPFNGGAPTGTFDLTFSNEGDSECRFFPVFVLDKEGFGLQTSSGPRIPYSLLDLYGQYDATPLGGRTVKNATRRAVVIAPHRQQVVRYLLTVPAETIPGDGVFSQQMQVEAEGMDGAPLGGRQMALGIDVLPSAIMSLSGAFRRSNGQALVDLGELKEGPAKVPLQLHIRSTRAYRLGVEIDQSRHAAAGRDRLVDPLSGGDQRQGRAVNGGRELCVTLGHGAAARFPADIVRHR